MHISWFIYLGLLLDFLSLFCIIGQVVGYSDRPGLPIGPVFYFIGFFSMLTMGQTPVHFSVILLVCCLLFFILVIFSGVLTYHGIKFFRRFRATEKLTLVSNSGDKTDFVDVIEKAIAHLVNNSVGKTHEGFVYLKSGKAKPNRAILHSMPSGQFEIQVTQSDPGYIKDGYFSKYAASLGFPIDSWKVGKFRQFVVPSEEHSRIPDFINLLFGKIYDEGDNDRIQAEIFLLQ